MDAVEALEDHPQRLGADAEDTGGHPQVGHGLGEDALEHHMETISIPTAISGPTTAVVRFWAISVSEAVVSGASGGIGSGHELVTETPAPELRWSWSGWPG
jgi:hypothetical protein